MLNVSSTGANLKGGFYLKTKAEMESGTGKFFPQSVFHFRPGFLVGDRKEFRLVEKIASGVMKVIDPILKGSSQKYRSMPADKLAKAMVSLSKNPAGKPTVLQFSDIMKCI
jgi:hypothetical protein